MIIVAGSDWARSIYAHRPTHFGPSPSQRRNGASSPAAGRTRKSNTAIGGALAAVFQVLNRNISSKKSLFSLACCFENVVRAFITKWTLVNLISPDQPDNAVRRLRCVPSAYLPSLTDVKNRALVTEHSTRVYRVTKHCTDPRTC